MSTKCIPTTAGYAVFNLDKAERYMIAESVIKKLGRKSLPAPEVKEIQIPSSGQ